VSEGAVPADLPEVSVIVVVHNERERIVDCLRSLEEQIIGSTDVEVVVVDDGSDDGTPNVVGDSFPNVRLIRKANEGADFSRNRGIEESRGALIAFIDSDCVARDGWINTLAEVLRHDPSTVVGGRVVHRGPFLRRVVGVADFGEYQGLRRREARCLPTCNLALARSTLGGVRFDPKLAAAGGDTVFTETLRRGGATLVYDPRLEVEHRPATGFDDLVGRARRYGESFVRARKLDHGLRYAGLVRAGVLGVAAATVGRIVLDWARLVRYRRSAGFSLIEIPAAAVVMAGRRLASLPAATRAVRQ
jgi:glycosyltransferase involved in cell wall biosynthesis